MWLAVPVSVYGNLLTSQYLGLWQIMLLDSLVEQDPGKSDPSLSRGFCKL